MRTALRLIAWNVGFGVSFAALVSALDRAASDAVGLALPYIASLWLLFLGAISAQRRGPVLAIALAAGFLLLVHAGVFGFVIWYVRGLGNPERATRFTLALAATVPAGVAALWWFARAKLSKPPIPA